MAKKSKFSQVSVKTVAKQSPADQIENILKLYRNDRPKARIEVEEQARRVWLQYLFQQHTEVCTTVEIEEVEERQQILGCGNPDGEIITNRITTRTVTKTVIPKTPVWAVKAALTGDWTVNRKFGELEALAICVDAGLMPESVLDAVSEYSSGFGESVLKSRLKSANEHDHDDNQPVSLPKPVE